MDCRYTLRCVSPNTVDDMLQMLSVGFSGQYLPPTIMEGSEEREGGSKGLVGRCTVNLYPR